MKIFEELDKVLNDCDNPKMLLLGTKTFERLSKELTRLGLGALEIYQDRGYAGVPTVVVAGRSELMQAIPGDEEFRVTINKEDLIQLLRFSIITEGMRQTLREALYK